MYISLVNQVWFAKVWEEYIVLIDSGVKSKSKPLDGGV